MKNFNLNLNKTFHLYRFLLTIRFQHFDFSHNDVDVASKVSKIMCFRLK
jgi:hypothetical protein